MKTSFVPWLVAGLVAVASSTLTHRPLNDLSAHTINSQAAVRSSTSATAPPASSESRYSDQHGARALLWRFASGKTLGHQASTGDAAASSVKPGHGILHEQLAGFDTDFIIA